MKGTTVKSMMIMALFAALLCLLAPWSVWVGPVPISLAVFVVLLMGSLLSPRQAVLTVLVYIILGLIGLPVFSGYEGGIAKLAGPSGGYIAAYPFMVLIVSLFVRNSTGRSSWIVKAAIGMTLALLCCYAIGSAWYAWQLGISVKQTLLVCVYPFVVGDVAKVVAAVLAGDRLYRVLHR